MIVELSISTVSFIHLPYTFLSRKYNTFIDITGTHRYAQNSSTVMFQVLTFTAISLFLCCREDLVSWCRLPAVTLRPASTPTSASLRMCAPSIRAVAPVQVLTFNKKREKPPLYGNFSLLMLQRGLGLLVPASCRHPPTRLRSYIRIPAAVRSKYSRRRSGSSPHIS